MIKNERQYKITKRFLKEFNSALKQVLRKKEPDIDPLLIQAEANGIKSKIDEFKKDLNEYRRLKIRKRTPVTSVYEIGEMLIRARIMNRMTQKRLADAIGVPEQQVQRWEDENYSKAALHTIYEIAKALNISSSAFLMSIKTK